MTTSPARVARVWRSNGWTLDDAGYPVHPDRDGRRRPFGALPPLVEDQPDGGCQAVPAFLFDRQLLLSCPRQ